MKCWNIVGVLALSCLLPVFAVEPFNGIEENGLTCHHQESGKCVAEKDTQNCMLPLEKLDCSDGEKCCKEEVRQSKDFEAAVSLLRKKKKSCKQDKKCTDVGGKCISKNGKCESQKNDTLCSEKQCTCCIGGSSTDNRFANLTSLMETMSDSIVSLTSNISDMSEDINNLKTAQDQMKTSQGQMKTLQGQMKTSQDQMKTSQGQMQNGIKHILEGCSMPYHPTLGCVTFIKTRMTWEAARTLCLQRGQRLLEGFTKEDYPLLRSYLAFYARWWVGVLKQQWLTSKKTVSKDLWYKGEPSGGSEECGHLYQGWTMGDFPCSVTMYALCQSF